MDLFNRIKNGEANAFRVSREFIVYLDDQGRKPATIKQFMASVKGYLNYIGVRIYSEDFRRQVRLPKNPRYREQPLTKEILIRLLRNLPAKLQTIVLVACASGMRIGELVQLKISDIDFSSTPTRIRLRAEITKTKEARETYLTSEASKALQDYLSRFFGWREGEKNDHLKDIIIFGRTSNRKKDSELRSSSSIIAENVLINSLNQYVKKIPELNKLNENGRRVVHFHALRKFFRTVVGDAVGRDYAEALMGHHFYLDTYYNLSEDKKRQMYLKAEPYLTISDYTKIEKNLSEILEKYAELEKQLAPFELYRKMVGKDLPDISLMSHNQK
jgi:integrase